MIFPILSDISWCFHWNFHFWELSLTAATFEYQRVSWDFTVLCFWGLPIKLL
jgi:hypothetical protein